MVERAEEPIQTEQEKKERDEFKSRPLSIPLWDLADARLFEDGRTTFKISEIQKELKNTSNTKQALTSVPQKLNVPMVNTKSNESSSTSQSNTPTVSPTTLLGSRTTGPVSVTPGRLSYAEAVTGTPTISKEQKTTEKDDDQEIIVVQDDEEEIDVQESEDNPLIVINPAPEKKVQFAEDINQRQESEDSGRVDQNDADKDLVENSEMESQSEPKDKETSANDLDGPGSKETEESKLVKNEQLKPVRGIRDFKLAQGNADKILESRLRSDSK